MKKHRGEMVERVVRESGYSLKSLAEHLKVSRRTLYNYFNQVDLSVELVMEIGRIIHYDFSPYLYANYAKGNSAPARAVTDAIVPEETAEYWRNKYIQLLEVHNALLRDKLVSKNK
jgi:predicted transcriptional regulator